MYNRPIISENLSVPDEYKTANFVLKPISIHHLIKDYGAVMSSVKHLKDLMDYNSCLKGLPLKKILLI